MRRSRAIGVAASCVTLALVAGCSSSASKSGSSTSKQGATQQFPVNANAAGTPKRGGTLHMLGVGDVDYMDPNISYYSVGYLGLRMWSRQLLTYPAQIGKTTAARPPATRGDSSQPKSSWSRTASTGGRPGS